MRRKDENEKIYKYNKKEGVKANLSERKKKDLAWSNQGFECR